MAEADLVVEAVDLISAALAEGSSAEAVLEAGGYPIPR